MNGEQLCTLAASPGGGEKINKYGYYPAITEQTQSIKIESVGLPKVILRPYVTIRTDIITESRYIGGLNSGLELPIICVANRINTNKDFIQLTGSDMVYTIKNPYSFSSITTAICNPDGTLADTDENNAVIYKLTKQNNLNKYNIVDQILKKKK